MFFLSIPPGVFVDAAQGAADAASSECAPALQPHELSGQLP